MAQNPSFANFYEIFCRFTIIPDISFPFDLGIEHAARSVLQTIRYGDDDSLKLSSVPTEALKLSLELLKQEAREPEAEKEHVEPLQRQKGHISSGAKTTSTRNQFRYTLTSSNSMGLLPPMNFGGAGVANTFEPKQQFQWKRATTPVIENMPTGERVSMGDSMVFEGDRNSPQPRMQRQQQSSYQKKSSVRREIAELFGSKDEKLTFIPFSPLFTGIFLSAEHLKFVNCLAWIILVRTFGTLTYTDFDGKDWDEYGRARRSLEAKYEVDPTPVGKANEMIPRLHTIQGSLLHSASFLYTQFFSSLGLSPQFEPYRDRCLSLWPSVVARVILISFVHSHHQMRGRSRSASAGEKSRMNHLDCVKRYFTSNFRLSVYQFVVHTLMGTHVNESMISQMCTNIFVSRDNSYFLSSEKMIDKLFATPIVIPERDHSSIGGTPAQSLVNSDPTTPSTRHSPSSQPVPLGGTGNSQVKHLSLSRIRYGIPVLFREATLPSISGGDEDEVTFGEFTLVNVVLSEDGSNELRETLSDLKKKELERQEQYQKRQERRSLLSVKKQDKRKRSIEPEEKERPRDAYNPRDPEPLFNKAHPFTFYSTHSSPLFKRMMKSDGAISQNKAAVLSSLEVSRRNMNETREKRRAKDVLRHSVAGTPETGERRRGRRGGMGEEERERTSEAENDPLEESQGRGIPIAPKRFRDDRWSADPHKQMSILRHPLRSSAMPLVFEEWEGTKPDRADAHKKPEKRKVRPKMMGSMQKSVGKGDGLRVDIGGGRGEEERHRRSQSVESGKGLLRNGSLRSSADTPFGGSQRLNPLSETKKSRGRELMSSTSVDVKASALTTADPKVWQTMRGLSDKDLDRSDALRKYRKERMEAHSRIVEAVSENERINERHSVKVREMLANPDSEEFTNTVAAILHQRGRDISSTVTPASHNVGISSTFNREEQIAREMMHETSKVLIKELREKEEKGQGEPSNVYVAKARQLRAEMEGKTGTDTSGKGDDDDDGKELEQTVVTTTVADRKKEVVGETDSLDTKDGYSKEHVLWGGQPLTRRRRTGLDRWFARTSKLVFEREEKALLEEVRLEKMQRKEAEEEAMERDEEKTPTQRIEYEKLASKYLPYPLSVQRSVELNRTQDSTSTPAVRRLEEAERRKWSGARGSDLLGVNPLIRSNKKIVHRSAWWRQREDDDWEGENSDGGMDQLAVFDSDNPIATPIRSRSPRSAKEAGWSEDGESGGERDTVPNTNTTDSHNVKRVGREGILKMIKESQGGQGGVLPTGADLSMILRQSNEDHDSNLYDMTHLPRKMRESVMMKITPPSTHSSSVSQQSGVAD
ncbi:hypothetical protein BLNAU_17010 [Blattamonas nauphoetae]|uniref:Uncharacterized protein n=1 Tax=Blattamonas nauphoetae TaxID=2049346 RepID=A0ABQ9X9X6_9EUKA|nr:hypothetical protein BLNAU_17010 [Blattamonas nauphoetae]